MISLLVNDLHYNPKKSILPFCFRFCRDLNSEIILSHIVDPRNIQGRYSPISDSSSITPEVMAYDEIIQKDLKESELIINKYVSRELPLVNYPLQIKYISEIGYSEEILIQIIKENEISLLVLNSHPVSEEGTIYNDISNLVKQCKIPVLLIPSGMSYNPFKHIVIFDPSEKEDIDSICDAIDLFKTIKAEFFVINEKKDTSGISNSVYCEKIKGKSGIEHIQVKKIFNEDYIKAISDLNNTIRVDLIISIYDNQNFFEKLFKKVPLEKILKNLTIPVLVLQRS